ncbi:MAG: enoyl-CoA hydratase/isomerase family protein [Acidimicrobiales bacterium]
MTELVAVADRTTDRGAVVRTLTLQRPDKLNPIDKATIAALEERIERASDDPAVRVVVVTGAGRAFSAGGDLEGYVELYRDAAAFRRFLETFGRVCDQLEAADFVSIAMINGACVAGGLELALACDLLVASSSAAIADGHLNFGQLPGAGGSQRLCRAVGLQHAKDLLLTGRTITGDEAAAIGLVVASVAPDELVSRVEAMADDVAGHSALAVRRMRELIRISQEMDRPEALQAEMDVVEDYATTSADATEGLVAFLEKRPPEWRGA